MFQNTIRIYHDRNTCICGELPPPLMPLLHSKADVNVLFSIMMYNKTPVILVDVYVIVRLIKRS